MRLSFTKFTILGSITIRNKFILMVVITTVERLSYQRPHCG
jgi:hypothetical protein